MVRHFTRGGVAALAVSAGLVLLFFAALASPSPSTWGKDAMETPHSIRVDVGFTRTLFGQYEGRLIEVTDTPMTWIVGDALWHNPWAHKACLLCTDPLKAQFTLVGPSGAYQLTRSAGDYPLYKADENTVSVVFLDQLPGKYELTTLLLNGEGGERARVETSFEVLGTSK